MITGTLPPLKYCDTKHFLFNTGTFIKSPSMFMHETEHPTLYAYMMITGEEMKGADNIGIH